MLTRLQDAGLRLNKKKCNFLVPSVTYLGYRIDSEGLHPTDEKLKAVQQAPAPTSVTELKAYLGLLTYYGRFLPTSHQYWHHFTHYYTKMLHGDGQLLNRSHLLNKWSKKLQLSSTDLVHFNPDLPIVFACDASSYGVGAVLAHKMLDGSERPIGFALRTLIQPEKGYS